MAMHSSGETMRCWLPMVRCSSSCPRAPASAAALAYSTSLPVAEKSQSGAMSACIASNAVRLHAASASSFALGSREDRAMQAPGKATPPRHQLGGGVARSLRIAGREKRHAPAPLQRIEPQAQLERGGGREQQLGQLLPD